ncbi:hypothetical protein [Neomoorella thermoacetica]|uniref:Uncharacterized protein n=1 Tax=Moorella thermoacetica (strain ATCC 39073 / JCM 9320) TaxID=264732 RepID=Q2RJF2_MOOTA|nr:hypothetical protein [Moorella thermoacetica]AKX93887.1 hypothetical protein MOTHE_c10850 [Moorella thermoacetica]AKX96528.1 hypothetical protein MOTHA_c11730 [Moorella thermoacetica]OIQ56257.1 hypothetical protein MORE_01140 [Moorella thermoacetica]OIQ57698.1 hypothetical protein MOCA_01140 [Moorella thermoacetica]QDA00342.1 hypothetical protein MothHH_01192 [Moorella thermoacetica]
MQPFPGKSNIILAKIKKGVVSQHDLNAVFDKIKEGSSDKKNPALEGLESALNEMQNDGEKEIGIEFECGDCCKKVINGSKLFFIMNFAVLLPARGDCLFMKVFSGGKLVDKQIMRAIIIPVERICAIEIQPVQVDP